MTWFLALSLLIQDGFADTGDTAATNDTAVNTATDTGDSGVVDDTASTETTTETTTETDSADTDSTETVTDTGSTTDTTTDTGGFVDTSAVGTTTAADLAGEAGGFGCATVGVGGVLAFWTAALVIGMRRED